MAYSEPQRSSRDRADQQPVFTEQEVRQVVRLLADAMAPDDGREAKVRRLCGGLAGMIDADGWIWIRTRVRKDLGPPANIDFVTGGAFGRGTLAEYADWSLEVHGEPPENARIKRHIELGEHFTLARPDLVPDEVWRTPQCVGHVKRMGLDEFLYSVVPLVEAGGGTVFSGAVMFRKPGKPDFDRQLCNLVHLVLSECGPLHRDGLDVARGEEVAQLTPRLHSVLTLLIDGQSVPQIAQRLCLSPHTVKDYVKQVYRHFGVGSQVELLRHFMSGSSNR